MNLPDLVRRKDRALEATGGVGTLEPHTRFGRQRAVRLAPGASLRIRDALAFTALKGFPTDLGWSVLGRWPGGVRVKRVSGGATALLGAARPALHGQPQPLRLDWPADAPGAEFDLLIEPEGPFAALLSVGPLLDPRKKLMPLIKGLGVEVGPGLNPLVRPSPEIDVYYVEEKSPEAWNEAYGRGKAATDALTPDIVARTRIGSANTLDHWAPGGLDFIFCNHVFEHLMNPLEVLRNWLSRLKPGRPVIGVVPDARFSFDARQPLSTLTEFRAEARAGGFEKTDEKYRRWIRYSAPNAKLAALKRRDYSVHVHFYTPDVFRLLADVLKREKLVESVFLNTAPNNKDFGFVLTKA